mmetsp:Transcript_39401/g.68270  ORF Transcript_39401/g.68270 Transcript_39401/m.68270 type:complete len:619 (-) Transcript_39401:19-1875(-)
MFPSFVNGWPSSTSRNEKDESEKGINARGLKNLGNTCFLNSVLQALSSCPSFTEHIKSLSELGNNSGKFSNSVHKCLSDIRNSATTSSYNPTPVLRLLAAFNPDFDGRDEQDALEVLESILACIKQENEAFVSHFKREHINKSSRLALSLIMPTVEVHTTKVNSFNCPFEGWSYSHLECQSCAKTIGPTANRILPTRHQLFTTLPLPIPSSTFSTSNRRGDNSAAVTAGCLPAGNASSEDVAYPRSNSGSSKISSERTGEKLLRGGSPIAVVRSSSSGPAGNQPEQQGEQRNTRTSPGYVPAPRTLFGSSPSIYNCLQEFFQEEELSGISCAACASLATLQKVEHKHALTVSSVRRNHKSAERGPSLQESDKSMDKDEVTLQILTSFQEDLKNMRVVGAKDAYVGDFDNEFVAHSPISHKKQAITHRPKTARGKARSVVEVDPAVVMQRDREMLLLSMKQPTFSDAIKSTGLSRLPPLLCLYLCRRTYDEVKGRMKKLVAHVSFPVLLNMDQFQSADGAHRPTYTQKSTGLSVTSMLSSTMKGRSWHASGSGGDYQLRAVVEHKGTADTGHYVAYCLVQEQPQRQWRLFSDEQHIQVPETTVLAAQATMLFYERVKAR